MNQLMKDFIELVSGSVKRECVSRLAATLTQDCAPCLKCLVPAGAQELRGKQGREEGGKRQICNPALSSLGSWGQWPGFAPLGEAPQRAPTQSSSLRTSMGACPSLGSGGLCL